jgi:ribokinase
LEKGKMKIVVIGSSNTDMVVQSGHETILGGTFFMNPGGKGANQAVAASRLGGNVTFVSKTGDDVFGKQTVQNLQKEGIHTDFVTIDPVHPSGVALIMVDAQGENCIVVAPGSNMALTPHDMNPVIDRLKSAEIVLLQLEIPLETVKNIIEIANRYGRRVILNPAPAQKLADSLLKNLFMITPNEAEAEILTGVRVTDTDSAKKAASILQAKGIEQVIITMGAGGAYLLSEKFSELIPAPKVDAVDTTAAGDTFNGALAVTLSEGYDIRKAVLFANRAASIAVTRPGAQASTPYRHELK